MLRQQVPANNRHVGRHRLPLCHYDLLLARLLAATLTSLRKTCQRSVSDCIAPVVGSCGLLGGGGGLGLACKYACRGTASAGQSKAGLITIGRHRAHAA